MAYETGSDLGYKNNLNLTPLTLAAKLAKKELFFHIMNIEREIYWQIGSITCAAYPLTQLDTIDLTTGQIQKESALNLIVFGEMTMHLELMEGPIIDLLHAKWNAFVKFRFYRQFICFAIYFLISITAFVIRPIHKLGVAAGSAGPANSTMLTPNISLSIVLPTSSILGTFLPFPTVNDSGNNNGLEDVNFNVNGTGFLDWLNVSDITNLSSTGSDFGMRLGHCIGKNVTVKDWVRFVCEILMVLGSVAYLLGALRECNFLGASMFFENLATAPSRVMFLFSCVLVLNMVALRLLCLDEFEDLVAIVVMLTTAPYFLFFCRG